jgi:hypothetical protein
MEKKKDGAGRIALRPTFRSYLKNAFWPNVFVGASFQILEILKYSSGLKRGPVATLNQNPIFEMASIIFKPDIPAFLLV